MIVNERRPDVAPPRERANPERQTSRYLVASPSGQSGPHGALVFLIAVALIAAVGMLYLLQTSHIASLGYEMSRLQDERESALVEQQQLAAQIAERQAITEVGVVARRDLGMVEMQDYIFLDVAFPEEPPVVQPEPERDERSALERFWGRLTGRSTAGDATDGGETR